MYRIQNIFRIDHKIFQHTFPVLILTIIASISYWFFYAPILYNDDWSLMIGRWYFNNLNWFDFIAERRPLTKAPILMFYSIFGLNIHVFYVVVWTLDVLAAILLYLLIVKFIPKNIPVAFATAAVFLVYPADFTHMWMTMIDIRLVVVLTLLYAHLLLIYADSGHRGALAGALLCLVISFGFYEGQLGIAMAWSLLLCLMSLVNSRKNWVGLLLPFGVGVIFTLWRTIGYSTVGVSDSYLGKVQLTPVVIISRLIRGYRVMIWAWLEPLIHAFGLNRWQAITIILLAMIFCICIVYVLTQIYHKSHSIRLPHKQRLDQIRRFMLIVFGGSIFIGAGYIPAVIVFRPTFSALNSRVNIFALPGAAATLVALLATVVLLLTWKQPQVNLMIMAGVAPLILLGMMVQLQVQYDNREAWKEQKQIWQEFFELAPDLKDGTSVYFILSGNENQKPSLNRNGQREPLFASWDVGAALNILYGKDSLRGDIISKEMFLEKGIKNRYSDEIEPYDYAVVAAYDGNLRQLRIIEDLEAENLVDFSVSNYAPYKHIIENPTTWVDFRWLVGVETKAQEE
jgi:hypothetical protein